MKIIFLRHALTRSNKEKRFSTKNTEISKDGYKDLDKAKINLKSYKIDEIYTSNLLRSQQTAKYLGFNDYKKDERLNEMNFGDFKGKRLEDTYKTYKDFYKKKKLNPFDTKYPDGESVRDVINRLNDFISEKSKEDKNILCISHGIAIRSAIFTILKDLSNFDKFWIDNGSLTVIDIKNKKLLIECVNKI